MRSCTGFPFAYGLCNCGLRANVWIVSFAPTLRIEWRDWKGDLVRSARRYFGKTVAISIPPEMASESDLLAYLEISPAELKKLWWFRDRMYSEFNIAKSSGKIRLITAPDRRLKMIQRRIATLLNQLYRIRNPVHAFVLDKSVKTNAEAHGDRRHVVNLDLEDFFGSITEARVAGLLASLGIPQRVSEIIARLCCRGAKLPQGAPTSPVISNMICFRLDTDLMLIAKASRSIYTRYADDITFSSYQPPASLFEGPVPPSGRFSPELLASSLREAISANGFVVNSEKTHYADRNSRRIVTGVKINAGLNVDRRYIRQIRAVLHSIEKSGLPAAQSKYSSAGGKGQVADHLRGKISYVAHLKGRADPVVRSIISRYNLSFRKSPISLEPTPEERRDRSVWVVQNQDDHGTCFFLKDVGLITSAHCVTGAMEVEVLHPSRHTTLFPAAILHRDEHRDLAILDTSAIPKSDFYEMELATAAVATMDRVVALGYPSWGLGERLNIRPGEVTVLTPKFGVPLVEVSQQLSQGMSGGPVIDREGKVVAVIRSGGPSEPRQFAVNAKEIAAASLMPPEEKPKRPQNATIIAAPRAHGLLAAISNQIRQRLRRWLEIDGK